MSEVSASKEIDDIIKQFDDWRADVLQRIRAIVTDADLDIAEATKWKSPSRPEGLPVWTHNGIVCFAEIWKDNVKLIFFKGAQLSDSENLFNSRLKSSTLRAIEFREGDSIDEPGLKALVHEAIELNAK